MSPAATPRKSQTLVVGFDLDGTLIDSRDDIRQALRLTLSKQGHDVSLADQVIIGPPLRKMLAPFLDLSQGQWDALYQDFRATYDHSGFPLTKPYPGCVQALETLKSLGCSLFLATNKPASATGPVLETFKLSRFFDLCLTPDSFSPQPGTKKDMLELAHKSFGEGRKFFFVGDSVDDLLAGRAHAMTTVAAMYGYQSAEALRQTQPDSWIESLSDLPKIVKSAYSLA